MSHRDVTVNAMQCAFLLLVIKMSSQSVFTQAQGIIICMAFDTGAFKSVIFCIVDLGLGFPVNAFRIFKPHGPNIPDTGFDFFWQISFTMWRQVTINAVYLDSPLVIVVRRELPALVRVGVNMARFTVFVFRCMYNGFVSKENQKRTQEGT
jgi:hypothetical protein